VISIGPYRFTETDARRTVENFDPLWHQFALGRDAGVLEPLRPRLTGDIAADLEPVWQAYTGAGPALRAAGQLPATSTGAVGSLQLGSGGVPKLTVESVEVDWHGVVGDRHAHRVHHGRPWQALCIWSAEVIDAFAAEGHPVAAGSCGENVTVRGLSWSDVRPGVRLQLGTVHCDVIAFALPCRTNARWFVDGDFSLMHHDRGPVSRVYAVVVQPGRIDAGDIATLEP
jgi:MOSC domain-containing protein YiiM